MNLSQKQLKLINDQKIAVLSTSSKDAKPRAIFVEINKAENDKIIFTDNQMDISNRNILENGQVALLIFPKDLSYYIKISGRAKYYSEGPDFDFVKSLETNSNYSPRGAIVVETEKITEVF